MKGANAAALSTKDEDALGQSIAVALTNQYQPVKNDALQRYVNLVGLAVASASPNPGGNWIFGVLDTQDVNAFSGPNGYVFVTRGAIQHMQDEAELAGVLAHEISHVCSHDGLNQIKTKEFVGAGAQAASAADSRLAQLSSMSDAGYDIITKTGYSQNQEFAADREGVKIMAAAGYNPESYLAFLRRVQSQEGSSGGKLMSTHPGIGQRVTRVSQELQSMSHAGATLAQRFQNNALNAH
jgi:predicted Zn-dependent protease